MGLSQPGSSTGARPPRSPPKRQVRTDGQRTGARGDSAMAGRLPVTRTVGPSYYRERRSFLSIRKGRGRARRLPAQVQIGVAEGIRGVVLDYKRGKAHLQ